MKLISTILAMFICSHIFAALTVEKLYSDHAVLQRNKPIVIRGTADAGSMVSLQFDKFNTTTLPNISGQWIATFPAMAVGGPYQLTITQGSQKIVVSDILMGDVWLCSGQSNMEWPVSKSAHYSEEIKDAAYPQIRQFYVAHNVNITPIATLPDENWVKASSSAVGDFTAVGFFFARKVYQETGVPIGLIHSSWGGSQVESWISKDAMLESDVLRDYGQKMPATWAGLDSMLEYRNKKYILGDGMKKVTLDDEKKYIKPDYDFTSWISADPMWQWDWKGVWAWRGNGYMAKKISLTETFVDKITTLGLAECYSHNDIYINGKRIFSGILKGKRQIIVPANTWQNGENTIMIKMNQVIEPEWFGLGLMGAGDDLYVQSGDIKVSLNDNKWKLMPSFAEPHTYARLSNNAGTIIYNAMIAPIIHYPIKGVLWYQGESNAGRAYEYRKSFPLMINDWRKKWKDDFPFYFVQLSSYGANQNSNEGSYWAELREAQTMTLSLPKTGMAVSTDIGDAKDIHPINKQDVGLRLARIALKNDYGKSVEISGPNYVSAKYQGNKAIITFANVANGLKTKDKYENIH
ncbi:MAG TPA: sialate O-acetylesterase [Saprospiraceae bacterium]|nr:sialate O-acetylesterase [Saprospiraceae bacterium]